MDDLYIFLWLRKILFWWQQIQSMKKILILGMGNSCRSQMAEGYLKSFCGEKAEVFSAAYDPQGINALAKASMQEDEIDMDSHYSNHIVEYLDQDFDFVVTVSNRAQKVMPKFSKQTMLVHKHFKDITNTKGVPQSIAQTFKMTREEIKLSLIHI